MGFEVEVLKCEIDVMGVEGSSVGLRMFFARMIWVRGRGV